MIINDGSPEETLPTKIWREFVKIIMCCPLWIFFPRNARWQTEPRGGYRALLISRSTLQNMAESQLPVLWISSKKLAKDVICLSFILTIQAKIIWSGKESLCLVSSVWNPEKVSKIKIKFCMLLLTQPNPDSPCQFLTGPAHPGRSSCTEIWAVQAEMINLAFWLISDAWNFEKA